MKYKRIEVPERPEWCEIGVVVENPTQGRGYIAEMAVYDERWQIRVEFGGGTRLWGGICDLTPVLEWQPQIGEMVACWDDEGVCFDRYTGFDGGKHEAGGVWWDHIYRIPPEWKNLPEQNCPEWFIQNSEELK